MFVWCDRCKRQFEKHEIRKCPYSKKGKSVCFWCCKGCRFVEWDGFFQKCGYLKTIKEMKSVLESEIKEVTA